MSSMKVHELAKELNMTSKDILDKISTMGIEVKSHMSVLSDIDVIAIRNTILRGKNNSETKIVKVAPKKVENNTVDEVKVVVKAAVKPSISPEARVAANNEQRPVAQSSQQRSTHQSNQQTATQHTPQKPTQEARQQSEPQMVDIY